MSWLHLLIPFLLLVYFGPGTLAPLLLLKQVRHAPALAISHRLFLFPGLCPLPRLPDIWKVNTLHLLNKCHLPNEAVFKVAIHLPSAFPTPLTLLWLSFSFHSFYQFHTYHITNLLTFCGRCLTPHYPSPGGISAHWEQQSFFCSPTYLRHLGKCSGHSRCLINICWLNEQTQFMPIMWEALH